MPPMKTLWSCIHWPLCSLSLPTCNHNYSTGMRPELVLREPSVLIDNLFQLLATYSSSRETTYWRSWIPIPPWSCLRWATRLTNLHINLFWPYVLFHFMRGTVLRNLISHNEKELCKLNFFAICSAENIIIIYSSCSFPLAFPYILAKQH